MQFRLSAVSVIITSIITIRLRPLYTQKRNNYDNNYLNGYDDNPALSFEKHLNILHWKSILVFQTFEFSLAACSVLDVYSNIAVESCSFEARGGKSICLEQRHRPCDMCSTCKVIVNSHLASMH